MHPTELLRRLGGVADHATLVRHAGETAARRAIDRGDVVRVARGRYALPSTAVALRESHALSGTLSLRNAALHHGWEVARVPDRPDVTVARKRHLVPAQRSRATFRYVDLEPDDVVDGVTTPRRTLLDCLQHLPPDEALAVADSALRHRAVTPAALLAIAGQARGRGSRVAREVAARAHGEAANPFESVLRHLALSVPGLDVVPQVNLYEPDGTFLARPDLVDRERRIVLEADSHAFHASRDALRRDCRRHTGLVVNGWMLLRFGWEDVMLRPAYVLDRLRGAVAMTGGTGQPPGRQDSPSITWLHPA